MPKPHGVGGIGGDLDIRDIRTAKEAASFPQHYGVCAAVDPGLSLDHALSGVGETFPSPCGLRR